MVKEYSDDEASSSDEDVDESPNEFDLDYVREQEYIHNQRLREELEREGNDDYYHEVPQNNEIVVRLEDQPEAVSKLLPDTSAHYQTDLTWNTKEEAKAWFVDKGKKLNQGLVFGKRSNINRLEIVCERSGAPTSHWSKSKPYVKKSEKCEYKCKSRKCHCPFKIVVGHSRLRGYFLRRVENGHHNHDTPHSLIGHSSVCGLKPHKKEKVRSMIASRPIDILRAIKVDDPENLSILRQIYTERAAQWKWSWNGREIMEQCEWLVEKHNYTMRKQVVDDKVQRIFLAHPDMIELARCFYPILFIDCTYKTNKYNMPLMNITCHTSDKKTFTIGWGFMDKENEVSYEWFLETLKDLYLPGQAPKIIITDKDKALMNAIEVVFPEAQHFLCTWHIQANIKTNCRHHIQKPKKPRGIQRDILEEERVSKLTEEQKAEEKKIADAEYIKAGIRWLEFRRDWDNVVHSMTIAQYECMLALFIATWSEVAKKAVDYCT